LWIVRQLCQGMEGSVRVDSSPGQGSTFSVSLPLQSSKDLK
jgi:two-component system, OmpR family, sensor kinase